MTKRRFPISLSALFLGLALFGLAPNEAKAIEVMCSNEYGQCEVANDPSWISCSCNNESSTGGTGGDEYAGLSEAELMAVCASELAYCTPGEEEGGEGTTTFGDGGEGESTSTDDGDDGIESMTSTSDDGEGEGTTDDGDPTADSGEGDVTTGGDGEGTTSDSGDSGDTATGEEGTTGDSGEEGTTGDSGEEGTTGDSDGESGEDDGGTALTAGDGDGDTAEDDGTGDDQGADEAKGCSVVNDPGLGVLALFGMFGLLGLRSRKRAS
jgi:MYXO-CTERM domain-containing protein